MSSIALQAPPRSRLAAELGWAAGSLGTAPLFNVMALFGLFFMTTFLGIAPAAAGAMLFFSKIYDAFLDPMMGSLSDRTRHRWGPRRIYLLIGALLLGSSFALFFNQPVLGGTASILVSLAFLLIFSSAYTIFGVPYLAMPPDFAKTYDARTRLMSFRVFFMVSGVMVGAAGSPLIVQGAGGALPAFRIMGAAIGLFATILCLVAFFSTRGLPYTAPTGPKPAFSFEVVLIAPFREMISAFGNAPFRLLTIAKLCQLAVLSTVQACTPYFFGFVLQVPTADIAKYLGTSTISGILVLPLHRKLIARFGKRQYYLVLLLLSAIGNASWILWVKGEPIAYFYMRAAFNGILSTGTLLCVLSMLPDTMEYDRLVSGRQRAGVISGAFTLVEKLAGACGPLLIGIVLQVSGLIQSRAPGVVQPPSALGAIHWGVSIIPAMLCLIAVPFVLSYRLDAQTLEQARRAAE